MIRPPLLLLPALAFAIHGCASAPAEDSSALEVVATSVTSVDETTTSASGLGDSNDSRPDSATTRPGPPTTSVGYAGPGTGAEGDTATSVSAGTTASTGGTAAPATSTPTTSAGDASNPIAVPVELLSDVTDSGAARCKWVDLHTVPVPPNPGFQGESLDSETVSGDGLWAITFYTMLYANCERQARGLEPFKPYTNEQMVAMQATVLGISEAHGGFGDRSKITGGVTAEGHGGGPLLGLEIASHDSSEDDDGNGLWSAHEIARRSASGNQQNDGAGLVDHGGAMTDPNKSCVYAAASLGATANGRMAIIIFYGSSSVC